MFSRRTGVFLTFYRSEKLKNQFSLLFQEPQLKPAIKYLLKGLKGEFYIHSKDKH